ncbi:MAG: hypothetical protein SAL07_23090 [Oscillatoria sp. PMC 1051.18]|nr:hypothetical protein [Oscillatoria salina]MEC4891919.1 hypothetical protein [Oscillatoria sp. PMC 1050.18]MEC5032798.1 hypothetical protein [Oscillatoria sp. PMC 1051.18]
MTPSRDLGEAGKSFPTIATKDFSILMPRPGWQKILGLMFADT